MHSFPPPGPAMLTFRPAEDADWDQAWTIQREAFQDLVTRTWGGWTEAQVKKCEDAWDAAKTRMVLRDGECIGWIRVERHDTYDWLDLIVLDPRHHGHGWGTTLMRMLIEEARTRRVPLWLSVHKDNAARRLYRTLGFAERPRDELRVFMVYPPSGDVTPPRAHS